MSWKTNRNKPFPQDKAFEKFYEYGYIPIESYKNNLIKIACIDKDGYIVMIARGSLGRVKEYQRFSIHANPKYYVRNMNLYGKRNNISSIVLNYLPSPTKNHVNLLCKCTCGKEFVCDANNWKSQYKTRCNTCVAKISNIEKQIYDYLLEHHINFIHQKRFEKCKDNRMLPFDFYLPDYNLCIEVDGEQHFREHNKFYQKNSQKNNIEDRIKKDKIKDLFCQQNNIDLIRLKYDIVRNNDFIKILNNKLNIC